MVVPIDLSSGLALERIMFSGSLWKDGALVGNISGTISKRASRKPISQRARRSSWYSGSFVVPTGVVVRLGETLELRLSDGTATTIKIETVSSGTSGPSVARFRSTGA